MSTCRCIMRDVEKILPQECSDRLNNNFPIESGKLWFITLGADINLTFTGANVKIFLLFSHLSFPSFSPRRWRSSRFIFWHAKKGFVSSRRLYVSSALLFFMLWMKWKSSLSENICGKFLFIAFSFDILSDGVKERRQSFFTCFGIERTLTRMNSALAWMKTRKLLASHRIHVQGKFCWVGSSGLCKEIFWCANCRINFSPFLSLSFPGYLTVTSADHWHYAEEEPNGVVKGESNASRASR